MEVNFHHLTTYRSIVYHMSGKRSNESFHLRISLYQDLEEEEKSIYVRYFEEIKI
jgi:hypothetical protein